MCFTVRPAYYIGQIVYFELNIDSIIQKYCVNKDKPELQCNGKCHLAKQLNQNTDKDNNLLSLIFESFLPVFISSNKDMKFYSYILDTLKNGNFGYYNAYFFLHESRAFRPPIF
mgnify:CR=1 FL=1